eukprot:403357851
MHADILNQAIISKKDQEFYEKLKNIRKSSIRKQTTNQLDLNIFKDHENFTNVETETDFTTIRGGMTNVNAQSIQNLLQNSSMVSLNQLNTQLRSNNLNQLDPPNPGLKKNQSEKYQHIKSKIETSSPLLRDMGFFKQKDLIDQVIEKESIRRSKRVSKLQLISGNESYMESSNQLSPIKSEGMFSDQEEPNSSLSKNHSSFFKHELLKLPIISKSSQKENIQVQHNNSSGIRKTRHNLQLDLKIDIVDPIFNNSESNTSQNLESSQYIVQKSPLLTSDQNLTFDLQKLLKQTPSVQDDKYLSPCLSSQNSNKFFPQTKDKSKFGSGLKKACQSKLQRELLIKIIDSSPKFEHQDTNYHYDFRANSSQMKREIKKKINQGLANLMSNMTHSKISEIQLQNQQKLFMDPNQRYDYSMLEQIQEDIKQEKKKSDYQNYILMRKGLNNAYKEEYKLTQFSKRFERRAYNSKIKINKDQLMNQLMVTFSNQSYLNQIKQSNKEISESLLKIGLNYDNYKTLAQSINSDYQFKNERQTLIQRNQNVLNTQDALKFEEILKNLKSNQLKSSYRKLRTIIKPQNVGKDTSPNNQTEEYTSDTTEEMDKVKELTRDNWRFGFTSPKVSSPLSGFITRNNGKLIQSADGRAFQEILNELNFEYKANEPIDSPFLRQFTNKKSQSTSLLQSPTFRGSFSSVALSPLSGSKKKKINPKYLMNNVFDDLTKTQGKNVNSAKFAGGVPHHSLSKKQINDQEIAEFSKYVNTLLYKSSDNFIKAKFKQFQKQQQKSQNQSLKTQQHILSPSQKENTVKNQDKLDYDEPNLNNFNQRMQQDLKQRDFLQKIIKDMSNKGDQRKLSRLKKLTEITQIMKHQLEGNMNVSVSESSNEDVNLSKQKQQTQLESKLIEKIRIELNRMDEEAKNTIKSKHKRNQRQSKSVNQKSESRKNLLQNLELHERENQTKNLVIQILPAFDQEQSNNIPKLELDAKSMIQSYKERRQSKQFYLQPLIVQ